MRIAYKAHKESFRYLTNASDTLLSGANQLAQAVMSCIMSEVTAALGQLNDTIKSMTGVATQTCIVVQNTQQVAVNMPGRITTDMCTDITKCFENIPTQPEAADSLVAALRWAARKAFSYRAASTGHPQVLAVSHHRGVPTVQWQNQPARNANQSAYVPRL